MKKCNKCNKIKNEENFVPNKTSKGGRTKICKKCRCKQMQNRKHKNKIIAMQYLGGACLKCNYSRRVGLTFHHRDPKIKSFGIAQHLNLSWEKLKKEVDKCDLLCANCHRETHHNQEKSIDKTITRIRHNKRKLKQIYLDYRGGKCVICKYNKCIAALAFHHREPENKKFEIASQNRLLKHVKDELDKCDIFCTNCHQELHFN